MCSRVVGRPLAEVEVGDSAGEQSYGKGQIRANRVRQPFRPRARARVFQSPGSDQDSTEGRVCGVDLLEIAANLRQVAGNVVSFPLAQ